VEVYGEHMDFKSWTVDAYSSSALTVWLYLFYEFHCEKTVRTCKYPLTKQPISFMSRWYVVTNKCIFATRNFCRGEFVIFGEENFPLKAYG